jgi:hypothetical protein
MKKIVLIIMFSFASNIAMQANTTTEIKSDKIETINAKTPGECVQEAIEYANGDYDKYMAYVRGCFSGLKAAN